MKSPSSTRARLPDHARSWRVPSGSYASGARCRTISSVAALGAVGTVLYLVCAVGVGFVSYRRSREIYDRPMLAAVAIAVVAGWACLLTVLFWILTGAPPLPERQP